MAKYRILIVDYEPRGIESLSAPLLKAGYEITVAKDGLAGIETFHRLKPDLAVIEAMLPKKHGFEVCQELKNTPHGSQTPILIVSSVYKGRKYRTQALHHYGCNGYMEKPIDAEKLVETVRQLLPAEPKPEPAPAEVARSKPNPIALSSAPAPSSRSVEVPSAAELEILERLDEILPDDLFGKPKPPKGELGPQGNTNVVPFDPARSSGCPGEVETIEPYSGATFHTNGGAAAAALQRHSLPLHESPPVGAIEPRATPRTLFLARQEDAPTGRGRGRNWLLGLALLALGSAVIFFFMML